MCSEDEGVAADAEILIRCPGVQDFTVQTPLDATVSGLKVLIAGRCGVPADQQHLFYKIRLLKENEQTLLSYGMESNGTIRVVPGVPGSTPPSDLHDLIQQLRNYKKRKLAEAKTELREMLQNLESVGSPSSLGTFQRLMTVHRSPMIVLGGENTCQEQDQSGGGIGVPTSTPPMCSEEEGGAADAEILIRCPGGPDFTVQMPLDATVSALKVLIAGRCGVPADQQHLFYKVRLLKENEQTLLSYGMESNGTIRMVPGVPASTPPSDLQDLIQQLRNYKKRKLVEANYELSELLQNLESVGSSSSPETFQRLMTCIDHL